MQSYHVPPSQRSARLSVGWAWFIFSILAILMNSLPGIVVFPRLIDHVGTQIFNEYEWVLFGYYGFISVFNALVLSLVLWGGLRYFAQFCFGRWYQWFGIYFSAQILFHVLWTLQRFFPYSNRFVSSMVITLCMATWLSYWQQVLLRPITTGQQRRLWMLTCIVSSGCVAVVNYVVSTAMIDLYQTVATLSFILITSDILINLIYVISTAFVLNLITRSPLATLGQPIAYRESQ